MSTKNICDKLKFEGIMSDGFGMAPRIIMRDVRLSIEAKAIYAYFQSFAGSSDRAFPSRDVIISELNISKNRYYKYLNELIQYNYIRIEREESDTGWKERNIYIIVSNPESNVNVSINKHTKSKSTKQQKNSKEVSSFKEIKSQNDNVNNDVMYSSSDALKKQLEISKLCESYPEEASYIRSVWKVISDMMTAEEIKISETVYRRTDLDKILVNLIPENVLDVVISITKYDGKIKNKKAWIQTCLLNSRYSTEEEINKKIEKLKQKYKKNITDNKTKVKEERHVQTPGQSEHLKRLKKELRELYSKRAIAILYKDTNNTETENRIKELECEIDKYIMKHNIGLSEHDIQDENN